MPPLILFFLFIKTAEGVISAPEPNIVGILITGIGFCENLLRP